MPTLKRRWTVADLEDLPDDGNRYEVIDGELFVTPSPSANHQVAIGALYLILTEYLRQDPIGFVFLSPADVIFSPERGVQPDLFVVPLIDGRRPRELSEIKHLLLAIEVLSPSTARADRVAKRVLYRDEGVEEYWIVDCESRTFERSTPVDPRVEILADELRWMPAGAAAPLIIDVPAYFTRVMDE